MVGQPVPATGARRVSNASDLSPGKISGCCPEGSKTVGGCLEGTHEYSYDREFGAKCAGPGRQTKVGKSLPLFWRIPTRYAKVAPFQRRRKGSAARKSVSDPGRVA